MKMLKLVSCLALTAALVPPAKAQNPQVGDLIFGLNRPCMDFDMNQNTCDPNIGEFSDTLELVTDLQGTPEPVSGTPWAMTTTSFIQSVEFDNFNGMSHNANGNIIGLNFGPPGPNGGSIYSFGTSGTIADGELIGMPQTGLGGTVLTTHLTGLSVSPDNSKIAVTGSDTGSVIVYDYTAADTMGGGAALSNARESGAATLLTGATSSTAWLDNDTILAFSPEGSLFTVDATTGTANFETFLNIAGGQATLSALEYNPDISPFVYGIVSFFAGGTTNEFIVLDPNNNFSVVNQFDMSVEANTLREIGFDAAGNLYMAQFGTEVGVFNNAAANAATLTAGDFTQIYDSAIFAAFSGMDIALTGDSPVVDGDFNNDDMWDCLDIDALVGEIASGSTDLSFDMNGDGLITVEDVTDMTDGWLAVGGAHNPGQTSGNAFLVGDANLDGIVDGLDFIEWNANKFTSIAEWSAGDFNADGVVDGLDFIGWNDNKFTSSGDVVAVPEPATAWLVMLGLGVAGLARRRRT